MTTKKEQQEFGEQNSFVRHHTDNLRLKPLFRITIFIVKEKQKQNLKEQSTGKNKQYCKEKLDQKINNYIIELPNEVVNTIFLGPNYSPYKKPSEQEVINVIKNMETSI